MASHWADGQRPPAKATNMFATDGEGGSLQVAENERIKTYDQPDEKWQQIQEQMSQLTQALPADRPASFAAATCSVGQLVAALARDGAVIIRNAVPASTCEQVIEEMRPYCEDYPLTTDGNKAKRPGCVLARSEASWALAAQPLLLELLEGVLGAQVVTKDKQRMQSQLVRAPYHTRRISQHPVQLDITQMVVCNAGAKAQSLHQDIGKHIYDFRGLLEPSVSTMWALRDFTPTNGATRVVPGSHTWGKFRTAEVEETVPAVMPAGSVLVFSAHTWHMVRVKSQCIPYIRVHT